MADNLGAGEGNRTPVVSLGRLGRVGKTAEIRQSECSAEREQAPNETGIARALTAGLPQVGFVYFIRAGRTATIKIGWALDPDKRLDAMQTGCPHKLLLIGFIPGGRAIEQEWHREWKHLRINREWFRLDTDLRMAINQRLYSADATRWMNLPIFSNSRRGTVRAVFQ